MTSRAARRVKRDARASAVAIEQDSLEDVAVGSDDANGTATAAALLAAESER